MKKTEKELLAEAHDVIQEVMEDVFLRVKDFGLDPEKYSPYVKAKQALKNLKEYHGLE